MRGILEERGKLLEFWLRIKLKGELFSQILCGKATGLVFIRIMLRDIGKCGLLSIFRTSVKRLFCYRPSVALLFIPPFPDLGMEG